jgi:hypothetical protein
MMPEIMHAFLKAHPQISLRSLVALDGRRLHAVPLAGDPAPVRIGIASLRQLRKTRVVETFERHCEAMISDGAIPGMTPPVERRRVKRR